MTKPFSVGRGIEFVGWKTWWNRRLPRLRIFGNLKKRINSFEKTYFRSVKSNSALSSDSIENNIANYINNLHAVLASYAGHLKHGLALRQWEQIWDKYLWLSVIFKHNDWWIEVR